MKASKLSLWLRSISSLEQFSIEFRKLKSKLKTKTNPSQSHTFFRASRRLPASPLSSQWLMSMLTFVLIDGREYFGLSLSSYRVRVRWFFDNQFKTSLSRINCIGNILSLG